MNERTPPPPTREYASVPPLAASAPPIARLGDYHLLRKLGQGGMGEIFLAKRIGMGGFEKAVVLKCMLESLSSSEEFVGMFFDEAHLAARLAHPNIAQIYDFGVADSRYYIAMEHIAGEDLMAIIRLLRESRAQMPIALAARIMAEVCAGLDYAHTLSEEGRPLGIIHRDVSPSNIMVSYQGAVKLLDFGIAKATSRVTETRAGSIKGKLSFLSPELIRGMDIDPRADLFSLGITFFALLTQQHPFHRDSEIATSHAIADSTDTPDPRRLRPDLPDDVVAVVLRALERDRERRFASAAEMGAALREVIARHAPATGSTELAAFLATLFGRERRDQKSHVPTLARPKVGDLAPRAPTPIEGAVAALRLSTLTTPATPLELAPTLEPPPSQGEVPTVAGLPRLTPTMPRRTGRVWILAPAGALALLLAAAGGTLLGRARQEVPAGLPAPAPASLPVRAAAAPAAAPAPVPASAPSASAAGRRAPAPERPTRVRRELVPLSERALHQVVQKAHPRFIDCVRRHAADLPGGSGQLNVELAVAGSGAVTAARATLAGVNSPALAGCLEGEALRLHFPRHPSQEVRFVFPLVYRRPD